MLDTSVMSCRVPCREQRQTRYTGKVSDPSTPDRGTLRAEQVAQTRAALLSAGRRLFGRHGFAATSVEDLAREARMTTGALYHHFPNKTALFEKIFETVHAELLEVSGRAAGEAHDALDALILAFDAFLDTTLQPEVQRIIIVDAPAVLGLARFIELDERYAFADLVTMLQAANASGAVRVEDPETTARLLLGAVTRGAMLIAQSDDQQATRNAVAQVIHGFLNGLVA